MSESTERTIEVCCEARELLQQVRLCWAELLMLLGPDNEDARNLHRCVREAIEYANTIESEASA